MRAPAARRHAGRDRLRRRPRGHGPALGGRRRALPARRRSRRRRVSGAAGQRATPSPRSARALPIPIEVGGGVRTVERAGASSSPLGVDRRDLRHRGSARARQWSRTRAGAFRAASRSASTRATARWRCRAGPRPARVDAVDLAQQLAGRSASPRSSTPTSAATARSRASTSRPPRAVAEAVSTPGDRLGRRRLARRHRSAAAAAERPASTASSSAGRSTPVRCSSPTRSVPRAAAPDGPGSPCWPSASSPAST